MMSALKPQQIVKCFALTLDDLLLGHDGDCEPDYSDYRV